MKSLIITLSLSTLLVANTTKSNASVVEVYQSLSQQESETREVKNFHGITSSGFFTVNVKMGDQESLTIEGDANDIKNIVVDVKNGILRIRPKVNFNGWKLTGKKLTVNITAKRLDGLLLTGSGKINVIDVMNSASAKIELSGSGEINANINTEAALVTVSGSGRINVSGKTGALNLEVSGSGNINARDLESETGKVEVSGSGNVVVNTKKDLNIALLGSGSVKYTGNPKVYIDKAGSGKVSNID